MKQVNHFYRRGSVSLRRALSLAALGTAALLTSMTGTAGAAEFGIASFDGAVSSEDGAPFTQAGGHPYEATTSIAFDSFTAPNGLGGEAIYPNQDVKDISVGLPPGFVVNPAATPQCKEAELEITGPFNVLFHPTCPAATQVGTVSLDLAVQFGEVTFPVYNVVPPPGRPAQLAFNVLGQEVVHLFPTVRSGSDSGISADILNTAQTDPFSATTLTLWGVPSDPSHDAQRGQNCFHLEGSETASCFQGGVGTGLPEKALLSNPTACSGPQTTTLEADPWSRPGVFDTASFVSHDNESNPIGITGCESVPFSPTITVQPTSAAADSPTGLTVDIHLPQEGLESPEGLATAALRKAVVTLPEGMSVNPSSANGLGGCTPAQIGLLGTDFAQPNPIHFTDAAAACTDSSKIGTVEISTPLLEQPLKGSVYLAQQNANPFGSLLAVYIVAEGQGIVLKLPGKVTTNAQTGAVTATFDNNPQLPFEDLHVEFFGGSRASLVNPPGCGGYATGAELSPWSGTAPVSSSSSFQITSGPNGQPCPNDEFNPRLEAGTTNPVAGNYSPFVLRLSREDGSQQLSTIAARLPKGLLAKLKGIPYCPDAALASISGEEGTGAAQLAGPSCPAASQVGTVTVGAGAGSNPFYLSTGKAYLAGPYKGAPLSLAVVTPALAGPFDLGNVVVRNALRVDPETAQVTAASDPLPTILHGIPLDLRDVRVDLDRPDFTRNPTSCDPTSIAGTIGSVAGTSAAVSDRFQVADCAALGFSPTLSLALKGKTGRAGHPALTATLRAKEGQANIGRISVALPHSEFLAQEHIRTVCTRVQFAAGACPKASIYGYAEARTPLLDQPLTGPVYLRSNGGERKLPDLVAALHGQIDLDLVGYIDSHRGGIRTTFQSVPDAPVSTFTLRMKGGGRGLLVNSTDLCRSTDRATVRMDGQNGKIHDSHPVLRNSCRGKGK
jgi:hypothetical protein